MKKNWQFVLAFAGVFILIFVILKLYPPPGSNQPAYHLIIGMQLTSSAFTNNGDIPVKYTCDGDGVSPPLTIAGVSPNAKTLELLVEDPDAPMGTYTHLDMKNIDPKTKGFTEGELKDFVPPCPPSGTHHYIFTLSALNDKGDLLAKTQLTGLYGRN